METLNYIAAWWRRRRKPDINTTGAMQDAPGGIADGVDYSQPVAYARWQQRAGISLQEASGQTYRSQFGNPYRSGADLPIAPTTEDPLLEWDYATRERVLSSCHSAYQRNPLANSIVQYTTDFVVGDGFNLSVKHSDVERVLLDFINDPDNDLREYERQAVVDLQVDGELFIRFFEDEGKTVAAPQRPWEVYYIRTQRGFFRRAELYIMQRYETEGDAPGGETRTVREEIPADEIQHVAINRHAYELRGRPELYRLLPWLRADKEWLEDRARQNKWRNALLWHVRVRNAGSAALAAVMNRWRRPPSPGSAYVSTDAEEVSAVTNNSGAADAGHDGRSIRLMSVLGARLPEYFFGDGSNANLATATRQELPALTKFETFQRIMVTQVWMPMFRRVIQNAVDAGDLPEIVPVQNSLGENIPNIDPVRTIDAFDVSYEPVTNDDMAALSAMLFGALDRGIVSVETVQERLGFDPHVERKQLAEEQQMYRDDTMTGRMPPALGNFPDGMAGVMDDEEYANDAVQPEATPTPA